MAFAAIPRGVDRAVPVAALAVAVVRAVLAVPQAALAGVAEDADTPRALDSQRWDRRWGPCLGRYPYNFRVDPKMPSEPG